MNPLKQLRNFEKLDKDKNIARKTARKVIIDLMLICMKKVAFGKLKIDDVEHLKNETKSFYQKFPDKENYQNAMMRIRQLETFCIDRKKFVKQNIG